MSLLQTQDGGNLTLSGVVVTIFSLNYLGYL